MTSMGTDAAAHLTLTDLRERTFVSVEQAGRCLGLGRSSSYQAAKRGDLPTLRIGRRVVVPTPRLLTLLGADAG